MRHAVSMRCVVLAPDVVEDELMQGVHVPLGIHERLELTQVVTQRRPNDVRHPPTPHTQSHTEGSETSTIGEGRHKTGRGAMGAIEGGGSDRKSVV